MGECPPGHSIERKDVNGHYEFKNCIYIPKEHQAKNRRDTVLLEHSGEKLCLNDWSRRLGVSTSFIKDRLSKNISFSEIVRQAREFVVLRHWREDLMESAV